MTIAIKRSTGIVGGLVRISVWVDGEKWVKLNQGEEILLSTEKEFSKVKVSQFFLGSAEATVKCGARIEVKQNYTTLSLFIIAVLSYFLGLSSQFVTFFSVGLMACIFISIYSIDNWFILEIK